MTQTDFFSNHPGWQHSNAGPEERAAAIAITPKLGRQKATVLQAIANMGRHGMSAFELEVRLSMPTGSVCGRIADLRKDGLIEQKGSREGRTKGLRVAVWIATERGRAALEGSVMAGVS